MRDPNPNAERAYLVSGPDAAGDTDLFATEDRNRADERFERMLTTHTNVRANWHERLGAEQGKNKR